MRSRDVAGMATGVLLGLALPCQMAQATPGFLNQGMNLRAGPGVDYPWIASLPPGTQAEIFGCLPEWSWCDVATQGLRGWVAGVGLQVLYDNQPEPLTGYGSEIGLPFIGFDFGNYWGQYYRGRPWYSQVDRWHGPGGPGGGSGRPYGDDGAGPYGAGRGGFAGQGPERDGPGGPNGFPDRVEPRGRPGSPGPGVIQGGPQPGFNRGDVDRGQQLDRNRGDANRGPQPQAGPRRGNQPGGINGHGSAGASQGPRPDGEGHPGPAQGPGPGSGRGGPGQQDPR